MPRLWPLARFSRLGDPSEPSLAPQTAESLAPYCSNLHQTVPRAASELPRSPAEVRLGQNPFDVAGADL